MLFFFSLSLVSCWSNVCKIFGLHVAKREMSLRVKPRLAMVGCFRDLSGYSPLPWHLQTKTRVVWGHVTRGKPECYLMLRGSFFLFIFWDSPWDYFWWHCVEVFSEYRCWMWEPTRAALVKLGVQSCAGREWERFWEFTWKCFSHLAVGQTKLTQTIIFLNTIAGPSTRTC